MHTGVTPGSEATGTAAPLSDGIPHARDVKPPTPHLTVPPYGGGARIIRADHVELALIARKAAPAARWAAMSNGAVSPACRPRRHSENLMMRLPPAVVPMDRGGLRNAVERLRALHGRTEVRATFGVGLADLRAELADRRLRPAA